MKRIDFISTGILSLPALIFADPERLVQSKKDPLPDKLVNDFVRAGHNDLAAVRQMLGENPALLNASWDWGAGDFETALGGASHMGDRSIAEYLVASGARADIFTFAMLGEVGTVKDMVSKFPSLLKSKGPHGISLYKHAVKGGDQALEMIDYLESQGITE